VAERPSRGFEGAPVTTMANRCGKRRGGRYTSAVRVGTRAKRELVMDGS
jgi:hypothetical protein